MPNVIIDTREATAVPDIVDKLNNLTDIEVKYMDAGDYFFPATNVGIERKTVNDFYQSLVDKRLWEQLSKISEAYDKPVLLIERSFDPLTNYDYLYGALPSIIYSWTKVKVHTTNSREETIKWLLRTAVYAGPSGNYFIPKLIKKQDTPKEIRKFMLMCVEGIGSVSADRILEIYPTLNAITKVDLEELLISVKKVSKPALKLLFESIHGTP